MTAEGTSRRVVLKSVAAIPLAFTFGLAFSPLFRFLLPTRRPLDLLGPSDQPAALESVTFKDSDFPADWTCLEFMFQQSYKEYNPESQEVRKIPGFILKLPGGDVVAYSRICPHLGCIFKFVPNPADVASGYNYKPPAGHEHPYFCCPCHFSVYDPLQNGKVVSGPAPRPPRSFTIEKQAGTYKIVSLEAGGIA
jgi:Rieske Fe-S protein